MRRFDRILSETVDDLDELPVDEVPETSEKSAKTAKEQGTDKLGRTGKAEIEHQYFSEKP